MALLKKSELDRCEVVNASTFPMIQCGHTEWVEEDGVIVGQKNLNRHVLSPDSDLTDEHPQIVALAGVFFTQAVKDAWAAKQAETL